MRSQGSFTLHLRGLLPSVNLGLPVHIDYKYCPVKDVTTKTFDIHNDQNFIVGFKWLSVTHPFSITPLQGNLKPGQTTTISCHFCPDDATAYKGVVRILFLSFGSQARNLISAIPPPLKECWQNPKYHKLYLRS